MIPIFRAHILITLQRRQPATISQEVQAGSGPASSLACLKKISSHSVLEKIHLKFSTHSAPQSNKNTTHFWQGQEHHWKYICEYDLWWRDTNSCVNSRNTCSAWKLVKFLQEKTKNKHRSQITNIREISYSYLVPQHACWYGGFITNLMILISVLRCD